MVPGRMRNQLYPKQYAAYISHSELREFKKKGVVFERDIEFGVEKPEEENESEENTEASIESVEEVKVKLLSVCYHLVY